MRHESREDGGGDLCACGRRAGLSCSSRGTGLRQDEVAVYKLIVGCGIFAHTARRGLVHVLPINCVILHPLDALARAPCGPSPGSQAAELRGTPSRCCSYFFSLQSPEACLGAGRKSLLLTWREAFSADVAMSGTNNVRTEWQDCKDHQPGRGLFKP